MHGTALALPSGKFTPRSSECNTIPLFGSHRRGAFIKQFVNLFFHMIQSTGNRDNAMHTGKPHILQQCEIGSDICKDNDGARFVLAAL